jgi:hypothetical protein
MYTIGNGDGNNWTCSNQKKATWIQYIDPPLSNAASTRASLVDGATPLYLNGFIKHLLAQRVGECARASCAACACLGARHGVLSIPPFKSTLALALAHSGF